VARRNARALFDLVGGFVYSQILSACVELRLFDILAPGPLPVPTLAARLGLPEAGTECLVKAATSLDLVAKLADGRYALGSLGAALRGNPSVVAMIAHHRMLYADLADPIGLLRGERKGAQLAEFWGYAASPDPASVSGENAAPYSTLMAQSQALVAAEILDSYPFGRHRRLLDVGGGEGAFLAEAGKRETGLGLMLFDLPAVAARASARLAAEGLGGRASVFAGSFLADPLPQGADIVSFVRVLHDHGDASVLAMLRAAHAALPKGGTILVAEPMSGTRGAEPIGDAYFGFYLAAMGSGRPRTVAELSDLLAMAGFSEARERPTHVPMIVRVLTARA
jgi:demethylspheroidene O-methyltransferase